MTSKALLAKIARLYYTENHNQRAIAQKLNMSVAGVSRALTRAKEEGIVEITIHESPEHDAALEALLETQFGLRECTVVHEDATEANATSAMARALSEILVRVLRNGDLLGVSWGETLRAMSDQIPNASNREADVVPIIGAMGTVETGIYPNAIATGFARKLNGKAYLVNAPAILSTPEICDSIKNDRAFRPVASNWNNVDTAVVSVSGISAADSVSRFEIFSEAELKQLRQLGVVGATNFDFLDAEGFQVTTELDRRILKIGFERLRAVRNLIVVAFGTHKVAAIRAALRSGIVNVLITDQSTARAVLAAEGTAAET